MGITHVVRGEEWISSTPEARAALRLARAGERPAFAHMPLLRNTDKSKISKRKNPAARLTWFREEGYLPEALRNFLALMGYSHARRRGDLHASTTWSRRFDWSRVNAVGPVFDLDKLGWLNGHYIRELPVDGPRRSHRRPPVARGRAAGGPDAEQRRLVAAATPLVQERMQVLREAEGDARLPARRRRRLRGRPGRGREAARRRRSGRCSRPRVAALGRLGTWSTPAIEAALRAALVDGLGLKPKVAFGAGPGRGDRPTRVAAAVRVDRAARPRPVARQVAGGARDQRRVAARR